MERQIDTSLAAARTAQSAWATWPIQQRLDVIARLRLGIARDPSMILTTVADKRPEADSIAAELLPLAEAARFLERVAARLLAPQRLHRGRPLWLAGVSAEIRREPLGVVLILGPSNFPLMLPGIQALQAIAAGNAVCVKPAAGCSGPMRVLRDLLAAAGLPAGIFTVLEDGVAAGMQAVRAGFDKIVLTGSAETGIQVLTAASSTLTPVTMELSGCDPVFVLPGANLDLVASCLAYGLRLNAGATCIAPRRVFVPSEMLPRLERRLQARTASFPGAPLAPSVQARLAAALAEAVAAGARVVANGQPESPGAVIVVHTPDASRTKLSLMREDLFAPVLSLIPVADVEGALAADRACPYGLGATIFGDPLAARALMPRLRAGSVVVNDIIVPTADPRLPFGGRCRSGFGVTRGAEGLLEMTALKSVSIRSGRFRPHLRPPEPGGAAMMRALLRLLHGGSKGRIAALGALLRARRWRGSAPATRPARIIAATSSRN